MDQYVCGVCGYNMVGYLPDRCPFCGASKDRFMTSEECSRRYHVEETEVTGNVSRLNSVPRLGIEHAAYRIDTGKKVYWIDSPSCFDVSLAPMDSILFTHFHFLGASNLYRKHFSSDVWMHEEDSGFKLCRGFEFDNRFDSDFEIDGIEAYHIDGHTPGFTCYFYDDVFFMCDYVFHSPKGMRFNPYGPQKETAEGGLYMRKLLEGRDIKKVCAVNYVMDYDEWIEGFDKLLSNL